MDRPVSGGAFLGRPSLNELDGGTSALSGDTEGGLVRQAWYRPAAAVGRVAVTKPGSSWGVLKLIDILT